LGEGCQLCATVVWHLLEGQVSKGFKA